MKRVLVLGLVGFLATACAEASTDEAVGGTPRFDPTPPPAPTPVDPSVSPTSFTALYRDFFGPGAPASCAGSSCHARGGGGTGAFTCGFDRAECATSAASIATNTVDKKATADFRASRLYANLRKASGESDRMPLGSTFVFDEAALARIDAWVKNGAKND
jgi:hypothetical protein